MFENKKVFDFQHLSFHKQLNFHELCMKKTHLGAWSFGNKEYLDLYQVLCQQNRDSNIKPRYLAAKNEYLISHILE